MKTELDRTHWLTGDKQWMQERKKKWLILDKWLTEKNEYCPDFPRREARAAARNYYLKGVVDAKFWGRLELSVLHPSPSKEVVQTLINAATAEGDNTWKGKYLPYVYGVFSYRPLVDLGLISEEALMITATTMCGETFDEMAALRQFDPYEKVSIAVDQQMTKILNWMEDDGKGEVVPFDYFYSHWRSMLRFIKQDNLEQCRYNVSQICRVIGEGMKHGLYDTDKKMQLAQEVQAYLVSDALDPCVREIARKWIDYDD